MMRKISILIVLLLHFLFETGWAQVDNKTADSLRQVLRLARSDSSRFNASNKLYDLYEESNRDSALIYANNTISVARKNDQVLLEGYSLTNKAYQFIHLGNYSGALESLLTAFRILENEENEKHYGWIMQSMSAHTFRLSSLARAHVMYALLMDFTENPEDEIQHFKISLKIAQEVNDLRREAIAYMNLGWAYNQYLNELDSAIFFHEEAERIAMKSEYVSYLALVYVSLGDIYLKKKNENLARQYLYKAKAISKKVNRLSGMAYASNRLTDFHLSNNKPDSSLYYARETTDILKRIGGEVDITINLGICYENMFKSYRLNHQSDSAYKYLELALITKDSIYQSRIKHLAEFQTLNFREQIRLRTLEEEMAKEQAKIRTYTLTSGILIFIIIAILLYRNNRQKQKANIQLQESFTNLRNTQSQLIQSEKMASLGELTAGIAHEIQNPLNFVNNFSEVSNELLDEMKTELDKGEIAEAKTIADDVKQNLEKILHHGKRADGIVKGMLQHSRSSSGVKEPTDINALADEYLRLAYHGLRAKDKSFNATMKTDFDTSIGNINIIPQDIGRVILNLINNAFYAVNERQKLLTTSNELLANYEQTVSVSTKKEGNKVLISVKDNGNGIPQKVLDKIFQPFFTTKPTGQGTGLGLSLSYDIVKAHGGEITVNSKDGVGSEFIIKLPIS